MSMFVYKGEGGVKNGPKSVYVVYGSPLINKWENNGSFFNVLNKTEIRVLFDNNKIHTYLHTSDAF